MSIDRQSGIIFFVCDECSDDLDSETTDFGTAWSAAKTTGWRSYQRDDVWQHSCPDCAKRFAQNPR